MMNLEKSRKDSAIALEIFFGLIFIFGIGWLYAGNKVRGWILLIGSLLVFSSTVTFILSSGGLGACCCAGPIYVSLIFDVMSLRKWLNDPNRKGDNIKTMLKRGYLIFFVGMIMIVILSYMIILRWPYILKALNLE